MVEFCVRCGGGVKANNVLIKCDVSECDNHVHDGCIQYNEGIPAEGRIIWLCSIHYQMPEHVNSGSQLDQQNQGQCSSSLRQINAPNNELNQSRNQDISSHNEFVENLLSFDEPANAQTRIRNSESQAQSVESLTNQNRVLNSHNNITIANNNNDRHNNSSSSIEELDCVRCNEYQESDMISCIGCVKNFHIACLSNNERSRIFDFSFSCETCFLVQSRMNSTASRLRNNNDRASRSDRNPRRQTRFNDFVTRREYDPHVNHTQAYRQNSNRHNLVSSSPRSSHYVRNSIPSRISHYSPIANSQVRHNTTNNVTRMTQSSSMNESFIHMMEKNSSRDLPEVTNSHLSWCTFYDTYCHTKGLFYDHENIVRIQKAIKDPEVLQIGGNNLFDIRTYDMTIHKINDRLGRNLNFINTEANALQALNKLKAENHKKIIDFIDRVVNFNNLAVAYREFSYTSNKIFINSLSQKLPVYLHNKWVTKQCQIESQQIILKLQHLVDVLEEELPIVSTRYRNSLLPSYDENKGTQKDHRVHNIDVKEPEVRKPKFDNKICWYHKTEQHPTHKCKALWDMDGEEVIKLAKQNNRCAICGQKDHYPCPFKDKLKCKVRDCSLKHYALYCYKRRAGSRPKDATNHNIREEPEEDVSYDLAEIDELCAELNSVELEPSEASCNNTRVARKFFTNVRPSDIVSNHFLNLHFTYNVCHNVRKYSVGRSASNLLGVVVIKINNRREAAFLIDSGSTVSLIEEQLADDLELYGPNLPLSLRWTGEQGRADEDSRIVKTEVFTLEGQAQGKHLYFRTLLDLKVCRQKFIAKDYLEKYDYLRTLKLYDYEYISGIIGIDNIWIFDSVTYKPENHKNDMPLGYRCPIGDYIMGTQFPLELTFDGLEGNECSSEAVTNNDENNNMQLTVEEQQELDQMERDALNIDENLPLESQREVYEDKIALEKLEKEVKRIEGSKQFEAPLLWRNENVILPTEDSYKLAVRRYFLVEKVTRAANKFIECETQIKNLLDKNYAKELTDKEIQNVTNKTFYIPIFFIHPEGKRNRMIWDMAAKVNGKSINDELLSGPDLYNDLLKIVFQMSEYENLIKGDLMEMFHQIRIKEEDTEALRFVFRFVDDEKLRIFKMLVLPFGARCSPTISQFVKNAIAKENLTNNLLASETILHSTYVDDVITSVRDIELAKSLPYDIRKILDTGGFSLLKINSNESQVIESLKFKFALENINHEKLFSSETIEKLLGYKVNFQNDTIMLALSSSKFSQTYLINDKTPTKRQVLQLLMSIYDPIGFFQFVVSKFKLLYRKLCISKCEWDEPIPINLVISWKAILDWIQQMKNVEIPRCYCKLNYSKVELWAFGDAGQDILCNVTYVRYLDEHNQQLAVRLNFAKTYTVPHKPKRTIPELELQASFNLCKMAKTVIEGHTITFDKVRYFTDNAAVFEWITNEAKKPTVYMRNRINKINEMTLKENWNWIPSEYMPADYGTKEESMLEISYDNFWFTPKIFHTPQRDWPAFRPTKIDSSIHLNINDGKQEESSTVDKNILHPKHYRSFDAIIYVGQFWMRMKKSLEIQKLREKVSKIEDAIKLEPNNQELEDDRIDLNRLICKEVFIMRQVSYMYSHIENIIFKACQIEAMPDEYELLKNGKTLPKRNYFYRFSPFLDENGIIRLRTRLTDSKNNIKLFGYDRIYPILLPKEHPLTNLIILKYHKANFHVLDKNTVNLIRSRFYIKHINFVVKKIVKEKCIFCIRHNARPDVPLMGDLPSVRLGCFVPAFTYCMADLTGAITVKLTRNTVAKRYIFVYTCLTTRALHLELIESLDSDSTLLALQSVINIRGAPVRIITDNGTNFIGGKNKMTEVAQKWNQIMLAKGIITKQIEWDFGPARSPHMQGAVERMVGLVKGALDKLLKMLGKRTEHLTDFTLRTILTEVMGLLNNRPIAFNAQYDDNCDFLTPNSFLLLRSNFQEVPYSDDKLGNLNKNWREVRKFTSILWNNWLKAYLPTILDREKWIDRTDPLKEGDLVITVDTSVTNSWRLGRILKVIQGSKDQVRQVEIMLGKKSQLIKDEDIKNKKKVLQLYNNEKITIITRPAIYVAKIRI